MRKASFYILFFIIISSLFIFFYYFFLNPPIKPEPAIAVLTSTAIKKDVTVRLQTMGTVEPYASVQVVSMVTGPLVAINFKEGDVVEKDQLLFEIDKRPFMSALNQAKANLAREEAIRTNNEEQLKRNEQLAKKGYLSKQDYSTLLATTKSSAATVKANQALLDNAQLQLSYTMIRAPISGKTGNILLKLGSVIREKEANLVTINQINPIYVSFSIPQNKLSVLQSNIKQNKTEVFAKIIGHPLEVGKITFLDNTVNTATGTIQVKATFANNEHLLWPGQYVTIDLPLEQLNQAVLIPSLAILSGQKNFYVYVVAPNAVVHMREVLVGPAIGEKTVIEKGLQAGESVVAAGQLRLKEGSKIMIRK